MSPRATHSDLELTFYSCAGGGPLERVVRQLVHAGVDARVSAPSAVTDWRARMSRGMVARARARLDAHLLTPLRAVASAMRSESSVLVPTTNPFHLPAWLVATRALHGARVVPLVYDLYPDALEAAGWSRDKSLASRALQWLNRTWFRAADGVVFIGDHMAAHACARYGTPAHWTVIETGADPEEFSRDLGTPKNDLQRWCAGRQLVLCYVGNMGRVHEWTTLAAAVPRFLERFPSSRIGVLVAASGPGVAYLRRAWASLDGDQVRFEAPLDDLAWAEVLRRCQIGLVTLRKEAAHTSVPSKAFSGMAAGQAIVAVAPPESDLARIITKHQCGEVVDPGNVDGVVAALSELASEPANLQRKREQAVAAVQDVYRMERMAQRWMDFTRTVRAAGSRRQVSSRAKRTLDVVGATVGLVVASPLLLVAGVAVRISMGSPVLFRQERPGLDSRSFGLMKFRTMREPAQGEKRLKTDAVRLTRIGSLLRATSVDELPTLWNVMKGDMSLVGPRPLLMEYLDRYTPQQARRHQVKPGITGWAQVNGRNALSWEEKFDLDVWYVDHGSLSLDLRILAATVAKVIRREGISHGGQATMPEFRGTADSATRTA